MTSPAPVVDGVQRHVVRTLVVAQMLGGVGMSAGVAVGALLAEQVSGSPRWAGLGGTFQILGAALIAIPYSYVAPRSYVETNITGTLNVLEAVRKHGTKRLVHTSTSEVYGTPETVPVTAIR